MEKISHAKPQRRQEYNNKYKCISEGVIPFGGILFCAINYYQDLKRKPQDLCKFIFPLRSLRLCARQEFFLHSYDRLIHV
jgi:hypothetical protein